MPYDLYSERLKQAEGGQPDVYIYDDLPQKFRYQVRHLIDGTVSDADKSGRLADVRFYDEVERELSEEFGVYSLGNRSSQTIKETVLTFITRCEWLQALDAIEYIFFKLKAYQEAGIGRNGIYYPYDSFVDRAIDTLNERFRKNQLGYRMENYRLIRIDSQFAHAEVIRPVLALLTDPVYQGANEEFLSAFEHYRHSRNKECLVECNKAFESTLKIICDKRQWQSKNRDASDLVRVCRDHGLFAGYQTKFLEGVTSTLIGGIPVLRNESSAHGQGATPTEVPDYLVRYGLNVTATAILLLVEADQALDEQPPKPAS